MQTFQDGQGQTWQIAVTVSGIRRVSAMTGVDLLDAAGGQIFAMLRDLLKVADILYALCKPQADALGIDADHFGELLAGDVLAAAIAALRADHINFFASPEDRANVALIWSKCEELRQAGCGLVEARIRTLNPVAILAALRDSGDGSGSSPESSASIPARSPSAN